MKILADASLPYLTELFSPSFQLTLYKTQDEVSGLLSSHDILLCRSTLNVTARLLAKSTLKCVATASSGIDHIDSDYLLSQNITLLDAKGCNARAVADYVVATLGFLFREKQILGHKAGIIGVGKVGTEVMTRLRAAGFEVICFDPPKAVQDHPFLSCTLEELATCDLICVHANLHKTAPYPSANLLDAHFFSQLKPGATIINAARGGIVNEMDLLKVCKPITYCTDVYQNEPNIYPELIDFATLCTPHIAGHSIEAKNKAVINICLQLHQLYGLALPQTSLSLLKKVPVLPATWTRDSCWQDCMLSIYNPLTDTQQLKSAADKKHAFLTQRRAHQNRHDFIFYDTDQLNQQTKLLLGH